MDFAEASRHEILLVGYKGHEMYPHVHQLQEDGRWTTQVHILRGDVVTLYTASNTWASREEAEVRSLDFGRKIIDGEIIPRKER